MNPQIVNKYQCCQEPNIIFSDIFDICTSCGAIYQKFDNNSTYQEDDKFQDIYINQKKYTYLINILNQNILKLSLKKYMILF